MEGEVLTMKNGVPTKENEIYKLYIVDDRPKTFELFMRRMMAHYMDEGRCMSFNFIFVLHESDEKKIKGDRTTPRQIIRNIFNDFYKSCTNQGIFDADERMKLEKVECVTYADKIYDDNDVYINGIKEEIESHIIPNGKPNGAILVDLMLYDPVDEKRLRENKQILSHMFLNNSCLSAHSMFFTNFGDEVIRLWKSLAPNGFSPDVTNRNLIDGLGAMDVGFPDKAYELSKKAHNELKNKGENFDGINS